MSREDPEQPLTPSHLLCGRRLMSLPDSNTSDSPDYDIDVQPRDLSRTMQYLNNILNHFWKRWRNEYLIELRNAHGHQSQNDAITSISIGDVVIVHEENQPRGKWRVGKILDLIAELIAVSEELLSKSEAREGNLCNLSVQFSDFTL